MTDQFSNALLISAIGMGLIFGAIFFLWGVMALLVHLTRDSETVKAVKEGQVNDLDLKRRAAAAAVTAALAHESSFEPHEFPLPPTALITAWQAVMRSKVLNKRGPVR